MRQSRTAERGKKTHKTPEELDELRGAAERTSQTETIEQSKTAATLIAEEDEGRKIN